MQCDQGIVAIQDIRPQTHTIQGKPILAVTRSQPTNIASLVRIEKDALGPNRPSQDITVTGNHQVWLHGKAVAAEDLIDTYRKVNSVDYTGESLYNIALPQYTFVRVHGLFLETLHPLHPLVSSVFYKKEKREKKRDIPVPPRKRVPMHIIS
jgi:hypothetical protein